MKRYEAALVESTAARDSMERVQALRGLVAVASPRYEEARDRLSGTGSKVEKLALIEAIQGMGDTSSEGTALLEKLLGDENEDVMARASFVVRELGVRVGFERIWRRDHPPRILRPLSADYGFSLEQVDGIAEARPWNDPAWEELDDRGRLALLSRAGSREALAGVIPSDPAKAPPWLPYRAEPVDTELLRELRLDPRPYVRAYAWLSLALAKDAEHQDAIRSCLGEAYEGAKPRYGCRREILGSDLRLWEDFGLFRPDTLRDLMAFEPRFASLIARELKRKETPFEWGELTAEPRSLKEGGRAFTEDERATYARWVHLERLGALVHERRYEDLERFLGDPEALTRVGTLNLRMWESPAFLALLPEDIGRRCFRILRTYAEGPPNGAKTDLVAAEIDKSLGMLARGDDAELLWTELRQSPDPLRDRQLLTRVAWGYTQRSASLRRMLARAFLDGSITAAEYPWPARTALTDMDLGSAPCGEGSFWNPLGLPAHPAPLAEAARTLASALAREHSPEESGRLSDWFVGLRRPQAATGTDPLDALIDPREAVRRHAVHHLRDRLPPDFAYLSDFTLADAQGWLGLERYKLGRPAERPLALPGPPMSDDDRTWLEGVLRAARAERLERAIDGASRADERRALESLGYLGGYQPTPELVQLPRGHFIALGPTFANEIKDLLASEEAPVRPAAAWALWHWSRDEDAAAVWMKDARSEDRETRARALMALQWIHFEPAASLFPDLLRDTDPALRQVGLRGVRARGSAEGMEVMRLVEDDNDTVAETAIEVLAAIAPEEAAVALEKLMFSSRTRVAWKAATVLPRIATLAQVDRAVALLDHPDTTDGDRRMLLLFLGRVTCDPAYYHVLAFRSIDGRVASLTPWWKEWWSVNRERKPKDWFRSHVERHVRAYADPDTSPGEALLARDVLERLHGLRFQLGQTSGPTDEDRHRVAEKWQAARGEEPWDMLARRDNVADENRELAVLMYPDQVRERLVAPLMASRMGGAPGDRRSWHAALVEEAGVDFGDPGPVVCDELRGRIVGEWLSWARSSGWIP